MSKISLKTIWKDEIEDFFEIRFLISNEKISCQFDAYITLQELKDNFSADIYKNLINNIPFKWQLTNTHSTKNIEISANLTEHKSRVNLFFYVNYQNDFVSFPDEVKANLLLEPNQLVTLQHKILQIEGKVDETILIEF